jgi:hypothetical protein
MRLHPALERVIVGSKRCLCDVYAQASPLRSEERPPSRQYTTLRRSLDLLCVSGEGRCKFAVTVCSDCQGGLVAPCVQRQCRCTAVATAAAVPANLSFDPPPPDVARGFHHRVTSGGGLPPFPCRCLDADAPVSPFCVLGIVHVAWPGLLQSAFLCFARCRRCRRRRYCRRRRRPCCRRRRRCCRRRRCRRRRRFCRRVVMVGVAVVSVAVVAAAAIAVVLVVLAMAVVVVAFVVVVC